MENIYLCVNDKEKDEITKQLKKEKKIFRVYINNEKMMFVAHQQVKYIVKVCRSFDSKKNLKEETVF